MNLSQEELTLARDWIKECIWREDFTEEEVDELSDEEVEKGIARHFSGGIEEFKRTCV